MNLDKTQAGIYTSLAMLVLFLLSGGCSCDRDKPENQENDKVPFFGEISGPVSRVKQVFYSMPSPLETAMLLRTSGAGFNEELLNPADNVGKYMTGKSMALNLGIYLANLSYASLYDQTQTCMRYMSASKQLADNLGILDAVDSHTIEKLEGNINNRDIIIDIVSETFMNSSSFLQENAREPFAAIMLAGSWVEGLYLALSLVDETELDDSPLAKRIIDKKLSMEILMLMLGENSHNNDVAEILVEMEKIETVFRLMEIQSSAIEVTTDPSDQVALLRSTTTGGMNITIFRNLKSTVTRIRNGFVS
jgi:hypothetical protein